MASHLPVRSQRDRRFLTIALLAVPVVLVPGALLFPGGFAATHDPVPAVLEVVSGDDQRAPPGEPLPEPLVVRVLDAGGDPYEGHAVTFTKDYPGPPNAELSEPEVETDSAGEAATILTLGDEPGKRPPRTYRVHAHAEGDLEGSPATFTARADEDVGGGGNDDGSGGGNDDAGGGDGGGGDDEGGESGSSSSGVRVLLGVSDSGPAPGDRLEVQATAVNQWPIPATGVSVRVELPAERLGYLEHRPSQGSYDPDSGIWAVGSLAAGQVARLAVSVTVLLPEGEER